MTRRVWKFQLAEHAEAQSVMMPRGAQILAVQTQAGRVTLWASVNPESPQERRTFGVFTTGEPYDPGVWQYIGTTQVHSFVWHVMEAP